MSDGAQTSLAIGAAILAMVFIDNIAIALAAFVLRMPVVRITFGYGRGVTIFRQRHFSIGLSPFLFAGWVKFADPLVGAEARSPAISRILAPLAGPLALVGAASLPLGWRAVDETFAAFPQLWRVLTDFRTPVNIIGALSPTLRETGLAGAAGVVLTKLAAFNLLPLTITSGGAALLALIDLLGGRNITVRLQVLAALPSLAVAATIVSVFAVRAILGRG